MARYGNIILVLSDNLFQDGNSGCATVVRLDQNQENEQ